MPAPGTIGTLAGVALWCGMAHMPCAPFTQAVVIIMLFAAGVWAANRAEALLNRHDPPAVIIDEFTAILITLYCVRPVILVVLGGVVLNRFFDIVKPFPINRLQALPGGWGIMLDDVAAGIASAVVLRGVVALYAVTH